MNLLPYPEYKDSGVEWLGAIPVSWTLCRVGDITKVINGFPFDSKLFGADGNQLIRIRDIDSTDTESKYAGNVIPQALVSRRDVLVGMDGDFNVGRWRGEGQALLNQRVLALRGDSNVLTILEHALTSPLSLINDVTYSTTVKHLSSTQVKKIKVALPESAAEISLLSAFLDHETAEIDAFIADQNELIGLLNERRAAVLDSIVWEQLEGTRRFPLKHVAAVTVGIVVTPSAWYVDDGVPALRGTNIKPETLNLSDLVRISEEGHLLHRKSQLKEGDVVVVRTGQAGAAVRIPAEHAGINAIDVLIVRPNPLLSGRYLEVLLNSPNIQRQVAQQSVGSIQSHFNVETLKSLVIPIPTTRQQHDVVGRWTSQRAEIDAAIADAEEAIKLSKERRAALISAAVTGKFDVRDHAYAEGTA